MHAKCISHVLWIRRVKWFAGCLEVLLTMNNKMLRRGFIVSRVCVWVSEARMERETEQENIKNWIKNKAQKRDRKKEREGKKKLPDRSDTRQMPTRVSVYLPLSKSMFTNLFIFFNINFYLFFFFLFPWFSLVYFHNIMIIKYISIHKIFMNRKYTVYQYYIWYHSRKNMNTFI